MCFFQAEGGIRDIGRDWSSDVCSSDLTKGRLRIALAPGERHAGLTVNEYETLLMRHDLSEVLRDPLRFMAEKAGHTLEIGRASWRARVQILVVAVSLKKTYKSAHHRSP